MGKKRIKLTEVRLGENVRKEEGTLWNYKRKKKEEYWKILWEFWVEKILKNKKKIRFADEKQQE